MPRFSVNPTYFLYCIRWKSTSAGFNAWDETGSFIYSFGKFLLCKSEMISDLLYTVFHFLGCCSQGFFLCLRSTSGGFLFPSRSGFRWWFSVSHTSLIEPQKRRVHGWQTRCDKGRSIVADCKMAVSTCCFMTEQVCRYIVLSWYRDVGWKLSPTCPFQTIHFSPTFSYYPAPVLLYFCWWGVDK